MMTMSAHGCANQLAGSNSILKYIFLCEVAFISATLFLPASGNAASSWSKPTWNSGNAAHSEPSRSKEKDLDADEEPAPLFSGGGGTSRRSASSENRNMTPFAPGSHNVSLGVGQNFLMGDLASQYNDALGVRMAYTMGVSEMFALEAAVGYSSHDQAGTPKIPKTYSLTTALAGMRVNLSWYDRIVPHAVIGMGFFNPSYELDDKGKTFSPFIFGIHAGPGIDLQLTKQIFFGATLRFQSLFSTRMYIPNSDQRLDVAGTYTALYLHTGVTF